MHRTKELRKIVTRFFIRSFYGLGGVLWFLLGREKRYKRETRPSLGSSFYRPPVHTQQRDTPTVTQVEFWWTKTLLVPALEETQCTRVHRVLEPPCRGLRCRWETSREQGLPRVRHLNAGVEEVRKQVPRGKEERKREKGRVRKK